MDYSHDLKNEKPPKALLSKGWRVLDITNCIEATSKNGNNQFIFTVMDVETSQENEVYCVTMPGKRWLLKSFLSSCGIQPDLTDGEYKWSIPDVLNKKIMGLVEHEPNDYYDRDGNLKQNFQSKITRTKPYIIAVTANQSVQPSSEEAPKSPAEVEWTE